MKRQSTAILLFSRTAVEEQSAKTFSYSLGKKGNQKIAECLIQNSLAVARKTKLPIFTSFSYDQIGDSFGLRLANAIELIFSKGFEKVITIGNDCPNLTSSNLLEVCKNLQHKDLILGPTNNGGVFLIGMNVTSFHKGRFSKLSWESEDLQEDFRKYAEYNLISSLWLKNLDDINCPIGLKNILDKIFQESIYIKKIKHILSAPQKFIQYIFDFTICKIVLRNLSLRAPPSF